MRNVALCASLLVLALGIPASLACDGKGDLAAAFAKQQKTPGWRSVVVSKGAAGEEQTQTFDYLTPDRMRRTIVVPGEKHPVETIGIGRWAWTNGGAGWEELQPQFARMVSSHMQQAMTVTPTVMAEFKCLGKQSLEGRDYLAYQTEPETGEDGETLVRTVYIDAATGLPAMNIIGPPVDPASGKADSLQANFLQKETYTYPTDIVIEKPVD